MGTLNAAIVAIIFAAVVYQAVTYLFAKSLDLADLVYGKGKHQYSSSKKGIYHPVVTPEMVEKAIAENPIVFVNKDDKNDYAEFLRENKSCGGFYDRNSNKVAVPAYGSGNKKVIAAHEMLHYIQYNNFFKREIENVFGIMLGCTKQARESYIGEIQAYGMNVAFFKSTKFKLVRLVVIYMIAKSLFSPTGLYRYCMRVEGLTFKDIVKDLYIATLSAETEKEVYKPLYNLVK